MQFLITDGQTFFHEEKRDLENTISYLEEHTLGYRIESTFLWAETQRWEGQNYEVDVRG
jgi:hypothetical protein